MAFRAKSNRTRSQITIRWRRVARFDEIRTPGLAREGRALYLPAPIWSQLRPLSKKWDQGRAGISNIVPPFRAAGPDCSSGLDARSLWTVAESGSGLRSNWQGRACWHHGLGGYVIIQAPMFSVRTDPGTDPVDVRRPPTPCLLLFFFFTSWLGIKVKTPSYSLIYSSTNCIFGCDLFYVTSDYSVAVFYDSYVHNNMKPTPIFNDFFLLPVHNLCTRQRHWRQCWLKQAYVIREESGFMW